MFNSDSDILTKSGLTAVQINTLLASRGVLAGLGDSFSAVEETFGINAFFGIAQAALETGWGTSAIAKDKNNLFGITAYDSNPYGDASEYDSTADCVQYWGNFLKTQYLTPGGAYYVSPTPAGIARHWASDPSYAAKIVSIMNLLFNEVPEAPIAPKPVAAPTANRVTVKPGQNMSVIAQDNGMTLSQLEHLNPQAGHPVGNFNDVWAADQLYISTPSTPALPAEPDPIYVIAVEGSTVSGWSAQYGLSPENDYAAFRALNPTVTNPDDIQLGVKYRVR